MALASSVVVTALRQLRSWGIKYFGQPSKEIFDFIAIRSHSSFELWQRKTIANFIQGLV
ncbi:hypothetical protein AGR3A_pa20021 [Agrobacterium tomkonis CFBP 6623]|uniref:Uncharacterized protein n=1 Tax=Agrobacterium tomkonis CFBP 6623 TaxID=1183432 RepID=A0A1S7S8Q8_9HYPH|nr:hypothetical protein AGR3A_pa20021 [Agrobacterium tomkonis CFBP 6623]